MRNTLIIILVLAVVGFASYGCQSPEPEKAAPKATANAEDIIQKAAQAAKEQKNVKKPAQRPPSPAACSPELLALADAALVEFKGQGEIDVVVVTDPLCWHCRLGHKLFGEYPEKYRSVKLAFFPRKSFIGSDMAAWIMEDAVGTERLKELIDFAYSDLKKVKTEDLVEARMIILTQFTEAFPDMLQGTTLADLYARLEKDNAAHVLEVAALAKAAKLPGTPVLIAGKNVVIGYGPDHWLKALEAKKICQ